MAIAGAGCGWATPKERESLLQQQQRENVAQHTTTNFVEKARHSPYPVSIYIPTEHGNIEITQPVPVESETKATNASDETSESEASGKTKDAETIPLYWKLIGGGIGLCIIAIGIGMLMKILKQSKAITAGWQWIDSGLQSVIHNARTIAATSTDPAVNQTIMTMVAEIERLRAEAAKD
jgi:hypothetical protein